MDNILVTYDDHYSIGDIMLLGLAGVWMTGNFILVDPNDPRKLESDYELSLMNVEPQDINEDLINGMLNN